MEDEMTLKALKALSDPTRYRIVQFLSQMCCRQAMLNEEGGVYEGPTASEVCCQVTGAEKISSTISHHIHELEGAEIVQIKRSGKRMLCTLNVQTLDLLVSQLSTLTQATGEPNVC